MMKQTYETFYVARQPILKADQSVYGYELLFRQGLDAIAADVIDQEHATVSVASCGFLRSSEDLQQGQRVLINFPGPLILEGAPRGLPKESVVVEILEDVEVTPALVESVAALREEGYAFAIDDYTGDPAFDALFPYVDLIKVDLMALTAEQLPMVTRKAARAKRPLLAEKVEDLETFERTKALGYELFQGYFFARPENLEGRRPPAATAGKLRIMQQLNESLDVEELAKLVQSEPSLAYRLLRFLNSSAFSFVQEINSIQHAVRLLGIQQVKHWLRLVLVAELKSEDSSPELVMMSMARAKYLETLAPDNDKDTFFLLGLLSLMDVMMQLPMDEILKRLPLEKRLVEALGADRGPLHDHLESARAWERADWDAVDDYIQRNNLDAQVVQRCIVDAMSWANKAFCGVC